MKCNIVRCHQDGSPMSAIDIDLSANPIIRIAPAVVKDTPGLVVTVSNRGDLFTVKPVMFHEILLRGSLVEMLPTSLQKDDGVWFVPGKGKENDAYMMRVRDSYVVVEITMDLRTLMQLKQRIEKAMDHLISY